MKIGEHEEKFNGTNQGFTITRKYVITPFARITGKLPMRGMTFHCLRQSFGTRLHAGGAPVQNIQNMMGHTSMMTTIISSHPQSVVS